MVAQTKITEGQFVLGTQRNPPTIHTHTQAKRASRCFSFKPPPPCRLVYGEANQRGSPILFGNRQDQKSTSPVLSANGLLCAVDCRRCSTYCPRVIIDPFPMKDGHSFSQPTLLKAGPQGLGKKPLSILSPKAKASANTCSLHRLKVSFPKSTAGNSQCLFTWTKFERSQPNSRTRGSWSNVSQPIHPGPLQQGNNTAVSFQNFIFLLQEREPSKFLFRPNPQT